MGVSKRKPQLCKGVEGSCHYKKSATNMQHKICLFFLEDTVCIYICSWY